MRTVQLIVIIEQQFNISFPVESMNGTDLKNVKLYLDAYMIL